MHKDAARNLRRAMRIVIADHANNLLQSTTGIDDKKAKSSILRSVNRIPLLSDEEIVDIHINSLEDAKVWLMCQDFAGNFPLPFYGWEQPSRDYFLSKLNIYAFISSDLSRNLNKVHLYDERGMGKDGNAMCSLRLYVLLDSLSKTKGQKIPKILFIILDNCVGQNKSQVSLMIIIFDQLTIKYNLIVLFPLDKRYLLLIRVIMS